MREEPLGIAADAAGQSREGPQNLPRLKIKHASAHVSEDVCGLEQARHRFRWGHEPFLIVVEGHPVSSYEELMRFAEQEGFRERDFLMVELQPLLAGG